MFVKSGISCYIYRVSNEISSTVVIDLLEFLESVKNCGNSVSKYFFLNSSC